MIPRAGRRAQVPVAAIDPLASPLRLSSNAAADIQTAPGAALTTSSTVAGMGWLDDEPPQQTAQTSVAPITPSAAASSTVPITQQPRVMIPGVSEGPGQPSLGFAAEEASPWISTNATTSPQRQQAPNSSLTEAYSDGASTLASLQREAAELDTKLAASESSCLELERATHDASKDLVNLTTQLEFARRQLSTMSESRAAFKLNHQQRMDNMRQRSALTVSEAQMATVSSIDAETRATCTKLQEDCAAAAQRVEMLEADLSEAMQSAADTPPEQAASMQLSDGVRSLMRNLRCEFSLGVKSLVAAEVRNALQEAQSRATEENARRAKQRSDALEEHRAGRSRAFDQFRSSRKKDRQDLAESVLADVRVQFRRRLEEKRGKTAVILRENEMRLERDAQQARNDAKVSLERVAARFVADAAALDKASAAREADLASRQDAEWHHTRKVLEIETETLQRTLEQEATYTARQSIKTFGEALQQSSSFGDAAETLLQRVRKMRDEVTFSVSAARSVSSDGGGETRRLVQEREAVVREMQSYTKAQKETLDRDRARLQSIFTLLEQRSGELESGLRKGRASLSASQQAVEQTRAVWARGLRTHVEESGRPLPSILDGVVDVLFEISIKARELQSKAKSLTGVRRSHFRQQLIADEQVGIKQDEAAKKVLEILGMYEQVTRAHAELDAKQKYWNAEKRELQGAKERLQSDVEAFNEAAALLQEVSEKLQQQSASVKHQRAAAAAAVAAAQQQYPGLGVASLSKQRDRAGERRGKHLDEGLLSKLNQSRYHYLYAGHGSPSRGLRQSLPADVPNDMFESLVKVPTDISGHSALPPQLGDGSDSGVHHASGSSEKEAKNLRPSQSDAVPTRSSSESLQQARQSLTTPSAES
jgi:hypothetical protein